MVSMTRSSPDWDLLMRTATSEAASTIVPTAKAGHAVEKDLEDALAASLVVPNHRVVLRMKTPHTYPGWTPQPGPLDLGIYAGDHVVVPCELKLHDIDWGLYDLLKVVSLFRADKAATAAYLITGGTKKEWTKSGLGRYFAPGVRTVGTLDLLRKNEKAWLGDLMYVHKKGKLESSGRPQTVASEVVLEGFEPYGCDIGGVGEVKVMSVRPAGDLMDVPEELRPTRRVP
jgi:hypothetical protein